MSQIISIDHAREIMGKNFLGVAEALRSFKFWQDREVLMAFERTLPTEAELVSCKDTHLLVADFGISFIDLCSRVRRGLIQVLCDPYEWFKSIEVPQWRLIRKTEAPRSFVGSNWLEQQALLTENDIVPSVRQMAYAIMLNYMENKEFLFEHIYVRTSDVDSNGNHVLLGHFGRGSLNVEMYWPAYRYKSLIGLASAKKPSL